MRFALPNFPGEFEVPDDWLSEANIIGNYAATDIFPCKHDAVRVALSEIEPPPRYRDYPKDYGGFDRKRLVYFLQCAASGQAIEPVPLRKLYTAQNLPTPYAYCVADGFHRFYAAIVAGHKFLPATID